MDHTSGDPGICRAFQLEDLSSHVPFARPRHELHPSRIPNDLHGGPIPDSGGNFPAPARVKLDELEVGKQSKVMGITENSESFLAYLGKSGIQLGVEFTLNERQDFDRSVEITLDGNTIQLSHEVAKNIFVAY